jgi:endonuclease YncB( thermonuclease family)
VERSLAETGGTHSAETCRFVAGFPKNRARTSRYAALMRRQGIFTLCTALGLGLAVLGAGAWLILARSLSASSVPAAGGSERTVTLPALRHVPPVVTYPTVSGVAQVADGDTLSLPDGTRVRLFGIDAPELSQRCNGVPCGQQSREGLRRLVGTAVVRCVGEDYDRYGRLVAICYVGHEDLGRTLVRNGFALAFRQYSERYVLEEIAAREERLGVWGAGQVEAPWLYRSRQGSR